MRLLKLRKLEKYLLENHFIDSRHIWCYAQVRAYFPASDKRVWGSGLVCINNDIFSLYDTQFNSTIIKPFFECKISNMESVSLEKHVFFYRLRFVFEENTFRLDMDDWKRFSGIVGLDQFLTDKY